MSTTTVANACDSLLEEVIRKGSQDNLTVILVAFPAFTAKSTLLENEGRDVNAIDLVIAENGPVSPTVSPLLSEQAVEPSSIMSNESPPMESLVRQLDFP